MEMFIDFAQAFLVLFCAWVIVFLILSFILYIYRTKMISKIIYYATKMISKITNFREYCTTWKYKKNPYPFQLTLRPFYKRSFWIFSRIFWARGDGSREDRNTFSNDKSIPYPSFDYTPRYEYVLLPHNLFLWHLGFGITLTSYIFYTHIQLWGWFWSLVFIILYPLVYWFIYSFFNEPILSHLSSCIPASEEGWLISLASKIKIWKKDYDLLHHQDNQPIVKNINKGNKQLRIFFPKNMQKKHQPFSFFGYSITIPSHRQKSYLSDNTTLQAIMVRAAMFDLFKVGKTTNKLGGLLNFILYWLAPIWMGFILLLIPLFYHLICPCKSNIETVSRLVIPLTLWAFLTGWFLYFQWHTLRQLGKQTITDAQLDDMPVGIHDEIKKIRLIPEDYQNRETSRMIQLLAAATFGTYVILLTLTATIIAGLSSEAKLTCNKTKNVSFFACQCDQNSKDLTATKDHPKSCKKEKSGNDNKK